MTLIVVSNRVVRPRADAPIDGGLAAALLPAVSLSGAVWVGSSGRTRPQLPADKDTFAQVESLGAGAVATVDFPTEHYSGYYEGFANSGLWPVLHSRTDLIRATEDDYRCYRAINAFMARALVRFARADALFWVHDYHFIGLGAQMRRHGIRQPIGFFLHTPFPARHILLSLPHHRELMSAMLSYDVIGFQTDEDRENFADYVEHELGLIVTEDGVLTTRGQTKLVSCPIGIDAKLFSERAAREAGRPEVSRLRASLHGARLVIGVDRLDYSKGLAHRFRAFDRMLQVEPDLKRTVSLLQIAVPSRGQIECYRHLRGELAELVGEINGRHSEVDWTPIRYLNKGFAQSILAGFYRTARVGLVTPLHDGMNLVAKEYVAAQNPLDPGVLVLSQFAGAARQLDAALLVNPHDVDGLARSIAVALAMSGDERRERWSTMMRELEASSLDRWFADFVNILSSCRVAAPTVHHPMLTRQIDAAAQSH